MLTYSFKDRGDAPLYEYLYRRIREDILSGALSKGERLPSRRALAEHLGVSAVTVEGAYRQLEAEGYIAVLPRRGAFVAETGGRYGGGRPAEEADGPPQREESGPPVLLDLGSSRTDTSRFPAATWARLTRQVLSEGTDALLVPAPHQGLLALRQAISADLRAFKGMEAPPERIVVGAGAEYLYLLLSQLLGREAVFALEDPGYPKIRMVYRQYGARCVPVALDGQGLRVDALYHSGATAAHLSPAHHYPTGLVTSIGRRHALLRWAEEREGVLIEDDYDSEFRFTGRPIPPLQSIDGGGRVIYLNTFSQTISPAMRMGYMVLPPRLYQRYRRELDFYACTVPVLEQQVLSRFLKGGHYEQHLSRMRKEYRLRRAAVLEAFRKSPFASRIAIAEQDAGLHFLLRVETDRTDDDLKRRARERGVRLRFLSEYAAIPREEYAHTLVVNYATLRPEDLPAAMALLQEVFCP